jgi:hypothetical protein
VIRRADAMGMESSRRTAAPKDKRRAPRHPRRIPCELWIRGARHIGTVKDVSRAGLFVETNAKAAPGTAVTLVFGAARGRTEIRVAGRVARIEKVAPEAATEGIGIGVEVTEPGALGRLIGDLRLAVS